jgi:uncharacterized protein YcaQ
VKALFLEEGVAPTAALASAVAGALDACARWHGTPRVVVGRCSPPSFARLLRQAVKGGD